MMRVRLRLLVASFNKAANDYALARLEVALNNARIASPPVVNRLGSQAGGEGEIAARWPRTQSQLAAASDYIATGNRGDLGVDHDLAWSRLERAAKMLAHYAESIEWVGIDSWANAAGEDSS